MELKKIYKYPFLEETKDYIGNSGILLEDITEIGFSEILERGKRRILDALDGKENVYDKPEREIFSYSASNIMLSCIKDDYLIKRYALFESKRVYKSMGEEDDEFIERVAQSLGARSERDNNEYKIHFTDYLRYGTGMRDPRWKLINKRVCKGYVYLSKENFLRILEEAYRRKINDDLPLNVPDEICKRMRGNINEIKKKLNEKKASFMRYEFSEINKDHFPPCMKFLVSEIKRGSNISHSGRFALTSFLSSVGMSRDEIIKIYRSSPDFDEEKTRYQVEHITGSSGTVYRCPSCSTMKTYGNCIGEDEDCRRVSNPMGRYYKGLKKQLSTKKREDKRSLRLKKF